MIKSEMTEHQQRVADFMRHAGQEIPLHPTVPGEDVRVLRAKLILEEAFETVRALGVEVRHVNGFGASAARVISHNGDLQFIARPANEFNLVEVVDGCADVSVVTVGTLLAIGVADKPVLEEVDASNLRKFGPGGHRRADGKWMKPADWQPPNLEAEIERQLVGPREVRNEIREYESKSEAVNAR